MNSVNKKISYQLENQICDQIWDQIPHVMSSQVWNKLRIQVFNQAVAPVLDRILEKSDEELDNYL